MNPQATWTAGTAASYSTSSRAFAAHHEQSLLVVTHDNDFASRTDRIIEMDDGKVIG
jgi:ABC-type lipoprotein export system ATPase subunit